MLLQEWVLRTILSTNTFSTTGFQFSLWIRRVVRDFVEIEFGTDMTIRKVVEHLKRCGYTLQWPTRQAFERNPWDVLRWMQEVHIFRLQNLREEMSRRIQI